MDPDSMMMMQPPPTTRLSIHSSHPAAAAAAARKCPGNVSVSADRWNQKLEQLREYAAEHDGCCDVPQKHPELGIWVNKQRNEKRRLDEGKSSQMTAERMRLLDSIGFRWPEPRGEALWNRHFSELVEYKKMTGHCNFPTKPREKENSALGRWVTNKKKGRITKQNEDKLNSIGFHWARSDDKFLVRCSEVLVGIKNTTNAGTDHKKHRHSL